MLGFKYFQFMLRLYRDCLRYNKKLIIVGEEYTSKTSGSCGELNNIGIKEVYCCEWCELEIDRDVNGARNILLKNLVPKI